MHVNRFVFHSNRIRARLYPWIDQKLAGADVELPAVPGAADDLVLAAVDELPAVGRAGRAGYRALAERGAAMRADVEKRVVAPLHIEDADGAAVQRHDLRPVRRNVRSRAGELLFGHAVPPPTPPRTPAAAAAANRPAVRSAQKSFRAIAAGCAAGRRHRNPNADSRRRRAECSRRPSPQASTRGAGFFRAAPAVACSS